VIRQFSLHRAYGFRGAPVPTGRTRY
jgi:hypothetical protein